MKAALASLLLLLAAPSRAQQVSISADVDKVSVALDEQIVLAVTVTGPQASLPEPQVPRLDNFSVYSSGRNQSISFVNGQVSSSIVFTYVLVPRFVGKGRIPPISITVGGQTAKTAPIDITVLKPGAPSAAPPAAAQGQPNGRQAAPRAGRSNRRARVFVTAEVDKKKAYVNEPVTLSVKFYTAMALLGNPQYDAPRTDGFLAEDLPPERHGSATILNQPYNYSEIKTALFPAHAGKLTISPATVHCQVGEDTSVDPFAPDFIDKFFSGGLMQPRTIELQSDVLVVDALPLPDAGKPKTFSGAVGRFTVSAALDRTSTRVGEAVNLTVTVAGAGNLKAVGDPALPELASARVFDTVSTLNLDKKNDVVSGSKAFRTVLVPRVSGDMTIPPIAFSYFEPREAAYKTVTTQPLTLKVAPAPAGSAPVAAGPSPSAPEGLTSVTEDIRYLKPAGGEPAVDRLLAGLAGAGPINAIPLAVLLLAGAAELLRVRRESDPAGVRFRGARRAAEQRIAHARATAQPQQAAALMAEALAGYLADKLGQPAAGLSLRRAQELLRRSCAPETLNMLKAVWEDLELQRFAPPSSADGASKTASDVLEQLLAVLDKEIKK